MSFGPAGVLHFQFSSWLQQIGDYQVPSEIIRYQAGFEQDRKKDYECNIANYHNVNQISSKQVNWVNYHHTITFITLRAMLTFCALMIPNKDEWGVQLPIPMLPRKYFLCDIAIYTTFTLQGYRLLVGLRPTSDWSFYRSGVLYDMTLLLHSYWTTLLI